MDILTEILTFLTDKRTIITGAALTISELIVIIVNLVRKIKNKPALKTASVYSNEISHLKILIWAANPLNLFKS